MKVPAQDVGDGHGGATTKQAWGNHIEFILTCIGYSVGLGNVWRFPYLVYQNGGGAFLIPYILMLLLVGFPLYCLELCFGQFASLGPFTIWKINPLFKGLGFAACLVCGYITIYFNVIISWALYFFFSCFTSTLPWTKCDNSWNTPNCTEGTNASLMTNYSKSPSDEFFYRHVLEITDEIGEMGGPRWQLILILLLTWIIVFLVLLKGVASLGKASYVMSTFPYILLLCVLVRGATLDGAVDGVKFYITPDWEKLAQLRVWGYAASQIFYSTGCGLGGLIAMASFNNFHSNSLRDAILIPTIETLSSFYAGFVIFSLLGYMAKIKGVSVGEVAAQGPGLVFVVYPEGLATMPVPQLWSALFFLMMVNIGYSTQFSQSEALISSFLDEFPDTLRVGRRPMLVRAVFCVAGFLLGLPMVMQGGFYLFEIVDSYGGGYPLLIVGLGELIAICWIYGYKNFAEDIALMVGHYPSMYFKICWIVVSPIVILAVLIFLITEEQGLYFQGIVKYPSEMMAVAWLVVAAPCVLIVLNAVIQYCNRGGWQLLKSNVKPLPDWGPALPQNRTGKYADKDLGAKSDSAWFTPSRRGSTNPDGLPSYSYFNDGFTDSFLGKSASSTGLEPIINGTPPVYITSHIKENQLNGPECL